MQLLCASFAISCVASSVGTVFLAGERPEILPKISLIKLPLAYLVIIASCYLWGLNGAALGNFLRVSLVSLDFYYAKKKFGSSITELFEELLPPATASILCALTALISIKSTVTMGLSSISGLILSIIIGAAIFFLTLRLLFKQAWDEAYAMMKVIAFK